MITQPEVYRLFAELDQLPGIMEPRIGRWRAWPVAKMQLVWTLMTPPEFNPARAASRFDQIGSRLKRYPKQLATALRQSRSLSSSASGVLAAYQIPRIHHFVDGKMRDSIYGDLLRGEGIKLPLVALEQSWGAVVSSAPGAVVDVDWHQSLAEMGATALMMTAGVREATTRLTTIVGPRMPLPSAQVRRKIGLALSLFEARRRIFGRLLRRLRARGLLVTYSPGRSGEIAAARELGIPVAEFQHGVVSAHCPDYAWPQSYGVLRSEMAIPDRVAMFGPEFRQQFMKSGFWSEQETPITGAAAIDLYRPVAAAYRRRPGRPRLLFMTQSTVRPTALAFWTEFGSARASSAYEVMIKVHPEERPKLMAYRALAEAASDRFTLLPMETNPMQAILESDIVVAYNSMSLIEALGLGRPAISLCGGAIPGGFVGSFGFSGLRPVMPHVASAEQMLALLAGRAGSEDALAQWRREATAHGIDYFAEGFLAAASKLVNDMLVLPSFAQSSHST